MAIFYRIGFEGKHDKRNQTGDCERKKSALRLASNCTRPRRQRPNVSLIRPDKANSTRTPTPCPGPPTEQGDPGPAPLIEAVHRQRFFFIRLNFSEGTVKSPSYPPKAEPRAMPHLPSTKKRTESAHARPTSLQHPPRKSGGAGAFMSSGLGPTERVARCCQHARHGNPTEINVTCR